MTYIAKEFMYIILCKYLYIVCIVFLLNLSHPQVGVLGDEEEWVSLREVENEPDAQMLEVPNLTPYTHYR